MSVLVFDIGGTFIKYAWMEKDGSILRQGKTPTPMDSLQHLMQDLESVLKQDEANTEGIALSMPGNIDPDSGLIYSPGALTYNHGINIKQQFSGFTSLPVSVENDGKCAAMAEVWEGNLKDCRNGAVLILGTGIGGGIVIDRKVLHGTHFFAGEVSYLLGNLHDQSMQSAFAWQASTAALIGNTARRKNMQADNITGEQVFEWILKKDPDALQAFDEMTDALSSEIYNLQCLLDPDRILIGGGVSRQKILLETVRQKLERIYSKIPFDIPQAQVDTCRYFNDSNLIGALYHYLQSENKRGN